MLYGELLTIGGPPTCMAVAFVLLVIGDFLFRESMNSYMEHEGHGMRNNRFAAPTPCFARM